MRTLDIRILSRYSACSSVDYQGNDFKALVYEYMVNGSLEQWLHSTTTEEPSVPPRKLSLLQRLNIAIDVAYALDYLHHQCETPIVHYDLKPSNFLLDAEMTGHVADFGIAKFLIEVVTRVPENQSRCIGIRGTIGYAALSTLQIILSTSLNNIFTLHPNLCICFLLTLLSMSKLQSMVWEVRFDVYSFGILLLEMFTEKSPTDEMFKDSLNIHNFVRTDVPE